jgi:hypothetical protein
MTSKYKNTIIYKIFSESSPENIYIGHTCLKLSHRFAIHRYTYRHKNNKLYKFMKENGGFENFKYEILEEFSCNDINEARQKERDYILLLNPTLNNNLPLRTGLEWRADSKKYNDYMRNYMREYVKRKEVKLSIIYTEILIDWN